MTDAIVPGKPLATTFGERPLLIVQAVLATVVVFWCGGPLLARGWRAVRTWRPDMFTLVGLGVGAAYLYSLAALAYQLSGAAPLSGVDAGAAEPGPGVAGGVAAGVELVAPRGEGAIQPFFETAAGIVVLVLIGQVLELRARQRTGEAVRQAAPAHPADRPGGPARRPGGGPAAGAGPARGRGPGPAQRAGAGGRHRQGGHDQHRRVDADRRAGAGREGAGDGGDGRHPERPRAR